MRVGVIRGDLPGPLFVADLVPTSQADKPLEGPGQTRYLSRPNPTAIANYLAAQSLSASATTLITATVPVGGPVDVSSATIKGVSGLSGASASQVTALQDLLAPHFAEDYWTKESFEVGQFSEMRSSSFNPDPTRQPPISSSAAISVVADDGSTLFTGTLPVLSSATLSSSLTLSGTFLCNSEDYFATTIIFKGNLTAKVTGKAILAAGGTLSATSIVIPASIVPAGTAATVTSVRVKYAREYSGLVAVS